jgi:hypothetical protein
MGERGGGEGVLGEKAAYKGMKGTIFLAAGRFFCF